MTELFIEKSKLIHGDKYDYSKVDYKNANTKIIIICKIHGEFYKTPSKHTNSKQGCAKCSGYYIPTTDEFIENAKLIHGDRYDYSKVDYKYSNENVIITCKVHGDFLQRPGNHINSKQGCSKCAGNINKSSQEFIEEAIKIHGDKYDYSKVDYKCANAKIIITCKIHGDILQTPNHHLQGSGCGKCGVIIRSNKSRKTLEEFIKKSRLVHGDKYDYSKVDYKSRHTKIIIICKIHGEFEQEAGNHLCGANCYKCSIITTSEKRKITLQEFIDRSNIKHDNKYDYSKSIYVNGTIKVIITCKIHGDFEQVPDSHLAGRCCPKCSLINSAKKRTLTIEDFIKKSRLVHGDKYDYSKVNIQYCDIPVIIICKIHGEFTKTPI